MPSILQDFSYDSAGRLVEIRRTEGASTLTTALYYDVDDQLVQEDRGSDTYFRFQGHRTSPTEGRPRSVLPQIRVYTAPSGQQHLRFAYIDVDGQAVHVYAQGGAVMATDVTGIYGVPLQGAPGDYTVTPGNWELDGLHGQEEDRTNEVMHFGARHTMFRDGMWMQPEPLLGMEPGALVGVPGAAGPQYAGANPMIFTDRSGYCIAMLLAACSAPTNKSVGDGVRDGLEAMGADPATAAGAGQVVEAGGNVVKAGVDKGAELIADQVIADRDAGEQTIERITDSSGAEVLYDSRGAAGGVRAGKAHTPAAKRVAREAAGPDCPRCGVTMTEPTRRTKGSTVDPAEAQGDHIFPKSKGGDGATVKNQDNIEVICASCNNKKSDTIE
ncbi:MAG: HNH endonuclease signature motif containing protein [Myxococcota bacterium]